MLHASPEKSGSTLVPLWLNSSNALLHKVKFEFPAMLNPGPRTQKERLSWFLLLWNKFDGSEKDRLLTNMRRLTSKGYFEGMGASMQLWCMMFTGANRFLKDPIHHTTTNVTEIDNKKLEFLQNFKQEHTAKHIHPNIFHRLPPKMKKQFERMRPCKRTSLLGKKAANLNIADFLKERYECSPSTMALSPCLCHPKRLCPVSPDLFDCEPETEEKLTIVTTGVPCVGNTSMNQVAGGDGDTSHQAASLFYGERSWLREVLVVLENTPRYCGGLLGENLTDTHTTYRVDVLGRQFGDGVDRGRMDAVALINTWRFTKPLELLMLDCAASVEMSVGDFWSEDTRGSLAESEELAKTRVTPVSPLDQLEWTDLLLPSQKQRMQHYQDQFDIRSKQSVGSNQNHEAGIFDLNQNPEVGRGRVSSDRVGALMPTFLKHGTLWHSEKSSPLLAIDQAKAHGWPVEPNEMEEFGAVISLRDCLVSGMMKRKELVRWLGDSWNIRSQGLVLMWILAHVEPVSRSYSLHNSVRLVVSIDDEHVEDLGALSENELDEDTDGGDNCVFDIELVSICSDSS